MSGGTPDSQGQVSLLGILNEAEFQMVRQLELRFSGASIDLADEEDRREVKGITRTVIRAALHQAVANRDREWSESLGFGPDGKPENTSSWKDQVAWVAREKERERAAKICESIACSYAELRFMSQAAAAIRQGDDDEGR